MNQREPDAIVHVPIFREASVNVGTPDAAIISFADNKVFKILRAYGPITRWLLNTGWFDGRDKKE